MKELLEHLKNYWKVYVTFLLLTAACFGIGSLFGGTSGGLALALLVDGLLMILIILLQQGRGGGLVGALGGMGGQSAFGTRAGDAFTGITIVLTVMWVLLAGFGGIALRADRGNQTFDTPEVRMLGEITVREGTTGKQDVAIPVYLSGVPSEKITVTLSVTASSEDAARRHKLNTGGQKVIFQAGENKLVQFATIPFEGNATSDGDWSFTVSMSDAAPAIGVAGETSTRVTIRDDELSREVPDLDKPPSSSISPAGSSRKLDAESGKESGKESGNPEGKREAPPEGTKKPADTGSAKSDGAKKADK